MTQKIIFYCSRNWWELISKTSSKASSFLSLPLQTLKNLNLVQCSHLPRFPYIVREKSRQYSGQLRAYSLEIQSHTPGDILLCDFPALGLSAKYPIFPKTFSLRRENDLPYRVVMRIKRRNLLKACSTKFYTHAHTHIP